MRSSFSSTAFPAPSSSAPSLSLKAVQLFVVFSHLFSFLLTLSLSLFLFCWSYSSSSRFIAMCSLPRKLVHSSSSLACSPFLPSLFSLSLYSSCRLIKPVDLPSHLFPLVIEIYEPACSRSPFQSILRSSWSFALKIKDLVLRRSGFKLYLRRAKFESEICDLYEASIPFSEFRYN